MSTIEQVYRNNFEERAYPFESTNRSRLNHAEFLGLAFTKLLGLRVSDRGSFLDDDQYVPREQDVGGGSQAHGGTCCSNRGDQPIALRFVKVARGFLPGWPELALPTTSAARARMVLMEISSEGSFWNGI